MADVPVGDMAREAERKQAQGTVERSPNRMRSVAKRSGNATRTVRPQRDYNRS